MAVNFQNVFSFSDCSICMSKTGPTMAIQHEGCYEKSIFHLDCILNLIKIKKIDVLPPTCVCDKLINMDSLKEIKQTPLSSRATAGLMRIAKDITPSAYISAAAVISVATTILSIMASGIGSSEKEETIDTIHLSAIFMGGVVAGSLIFEAIKKHSYHGE